MSRIPSRPFGAPSAACAALALLAACAGTEPARKPTGDAQRSKEAFMEMAQVLTHPRCLNCHAQGDSPTQGDAMVAHEPPVVGGNTGMGVPAMRCSVCHGEANVPLVEQAGAVPGAPTWQLAPANLAWQGKSTGEICRQLKELVGGGGLSPEEMAERNRTDPLTSWAWAPGEGRTPAPGTQADFVKQTRAWAENGAHCPDG
jgi:hypothetical protein